MPKRPALVAPARACDSHTHVFATVEEFPLSASASYVPPLAPASAHRQMLDTLGFRRGVLVQPAPYGLDLSVLLDAIRGGDGRLKGIGTATSETSESVLAALSQGGICGLRFTEARLPNGARYHGSVGADQLIALAPRMKSLAMHAQLWPGPDELPELLQALLPLDVPIVLEHMGGIDIRRGVEDRAFKRVLALLREERIWVKLTVCRRSSAAPEYRDLRPFHDALVDANHRRLVWGSDWPFVRMDERAPDAGQLVDLFGDWVRDPALRTAILADNPQALYQFDH